MITAQVGTEAPEAANQNRENETSAHRNRSRSPNPARGSQPGMRPS